MSHGKRRTQLFPHQVSDGNIGAITEPVNVLVALNKESVDLISKSWLMMRVAIYDSEKIPDISANGAFRRTLREAGAEKAGDKVHDQHRRSRRGAGQW